MNNLIECPICSNKIESKRYSLQDVDIYFCKDCSHHFSDPNSIHHEEEYADDYYFEKHRNWFENPNYKLFNYIANFISEQNNQSLNILDIGCGDGALLKYLASKYPQHKYVGIDYHENDSTSQVQFLKGDISNTHFERKFDLIINLNVIEHIWDVQNYLQKIKSLMLDNAHLISMTINEDSLVYRASRIGKALSINIAIERLYEKHHLNHFSANSLAKLHKQSGFDIYKHYFHPLYLPAVDLPPKLNKLGRVFFKSLLYLFTAAEIITRKTTFQTLIASRKSL